MAEFVDGINIETSSYIITKTDQKGNSKTIIDCPALAEYIRSNMNFLNVTDNARQTTSRYCYTGGCYRLISELQLKGIIKEFIRPSCYIKMRDVTEVYQLLITDLNYESRAGLNADENIINFQNGILDLRTWKLLPHDPKYHSTIQIPCNYVADAGRPDDSKFEEYMQSLCAGNDEAEKRRVILQFMGVAISNINGSRPKKALFLVGKGDSGKSQIKNLVSRIVGGENTSGIDLKALEARFGTSVIYGKRVIGSDDMSFMTLSEFEVFKKVTGGGELSAEFKNENAFTFIYGGICWFCCNQMPKFGGDKGDHVYERMVIIPCDNSIPPEKQDAFICDKMYAEREYIVSECMKALRDVIANGYRYDVPEASKTYRETYKQENNTFLQFIEECTMPRPARTTDNVTKTVLYEVYKAWCNLYHNGYAESKDSVLQLLKTTGKDREKKNSGGQRFWADFTLTDEINKHFTRMYGIGAVPDADDDSKSPKPTQTEMTWNDEEVSAALNSIRRVK